MHRMRQPGALFSVVFSFSNSQLSLTHRLPLIARIFITFNTRSRLNISTFNTGTGVSRRHAAHRSIRYSARLREQLENLFSAEKRWPQMLTRFEGGGLRNPKSDWHVPCPKGLAVFKYLTVGPPFFHVSWIQEQYVIFKTEERHPWLCSGYRDTHIQKKQHVLPRRKVAELNLLPHVMAGGGGFVNPLCMYVADLDLTHDCMCTLMHPAGRIAGTTRGFQAIDADCSPCLKCSRLKADFNSLLCC